MKGIENQTGDKLLIMRVTSPAAQTATPPSKHWQAHLPIRRYAGLIPWILAICFGLPGYSVQPGGTESPLAPKSPRNANYRLMFLEDPGQGDIRLRVRIHWSFSPTPRNQVTDRVLLNLDPQTWGAELDGDIRLTDVEAGGEPVNCEAVEANRIYVVHLREPVFGGRNTTLSLTVHYKLTAFQRHPVLAKFFPQVVAFEEQWLHQAWGPPTEFGNIVVQFPAVMAQTPVTSALPLPEAVHSYALTDQVGCAFYFGTKEFDAVAADPFAWSVDRAFDLSSIANLVQELRDLGMETAIPLVLIRGETPRRAPGMIMAPDEASLKPLIAAMILETRYGIYHRQPEDSVLLVASVLTEWPEDFPGPCPAWSRTPPRQNPLDWMSTHPMFTFLQSWKPSLERNLGPWCHAHGYRLQALSTALSEWGVPLPEAPCQGEPRVVLQGCRGGTFHYLVESGSFTLAPSFLLAELQDGSVVRMELPDPPFSLPRRFPAPVLRVTWDPLKMQKLEVAPCQTPSNFSAVQALRHALKKRLWQRLVP